MIKMEELTFVPRQFTLDEWNEREYELAERKEELESQKEELNAAVEELMSKNEYLSRTLDELTQRKMELDQLIYRMSHDLRTPVTSILGVCHVMKIEGLPTSFYFHLDHIQKKGMELDALLKTLSSFSQTSLEPISIEEINGRKLVTDVLENFRADKSFTEAVFSLQYEGHTEFQSDLAKLFIMMKQLIKNALDFRSQVRSPQINIKVAVNESFEFEISDNGVGIDLAVQPSIYKMFYRGSDLSKGSGLGLYIVKQIVDRVKGIITFQSSTVGTTFHVTIPLTKPLP